MSNYRPSWGIEPMMNMKTTTKIICILSLFCFLCLLRFDDIHGQDEISHYMKLTRLLFRDGYSHPEELITFSPHLYPLSVWGVSELLGGINSFTMRLTGVLWWVALFGCILWMERQERFPLAVLMCLTAPLTVASAVIVEIDQTVMPFFAFLLVWSVETWLEHGGWWRLSLTGLIFCLCLWCRLSTPLVLMPLLIVYAFWKTRKVRKTLFLLLALTVGFGGFFGTWRFYGKLTGVHWQGVFEYLARSFNETTVGARASGLSRTAQSFVMAVLWGMTPPFLILVGAALWHHAKGLWKEHATQQSAEREPCLFLLSGVWLWCAFTVVGGSLFGFPKYQVATYPLIFLGLVQHGRRHWEWGKPVVFMRRWLWVFGVAVFLLALFLMCDPILVMRNNIRFAQLHNDGTLQYHVLYLIMTQLLAYIMIFAAIWVLSRKDGFSRMILLLMAGLAVNGALLCWQVFGGYNCGYMYGDCGGTRGLARYINDRGYDPSRILVPHEVLEALGKPELTFPYPFLLDDDMDALRKKIEQEKPTLIALSVLAFPVNSIRAFLNDNEMQILLDKHYVKAQFPMRVGNCSFQGDCEMSPKGSNISNPRLSGAKPGGSNPLQDNDLEEVEPTLLGNRAYVKHDMGKNHVKHDMGNYMVWELKKDTK